MHSKENSKRPSYQRLPGWISSPLRFALKLSIALFIISIGVTCFYSYLARSYDMRKFADLPAHTIILDEAETEVANFKGENRRLISYEEIPNHLKIALFAREDADFESHWGVKFSGLARAFFENVKQGRFAQGGSTLSMQLVKNTFGNKKKTIHRKLLEIALTYRLEMHYTKDAILTHYLNRIYFGSGCYGIEEAALTYFGKKTIELHPGESALLVGIIKGPELFSPKKHPEKAIQQRDQVLQRMLDLKKISKEQWAKIQSLPIHFKKNNRQKKVKNYTLQLVERHLKEILTDEQLKHGGYEIRTSMNSRMISEIDQFFLNNNALEENDIQTSAVVLNSKTGAIMALNGGRDITKFEWNIALNSKRKLGSLFHPLLYLATAHYNEVPIFGQPIQSGTQITYSKAARFARLLDLSEKIVENEDLYRGNIASSPLKTASAFTIFPNLGRIPQSYIIREIKDSANNKIFSKINRIENITQEQNAQSVFKYYNNNKNHTTVHSITRGKSDAWTVYMSPQLTVLLWYGKNDGSAIDLSKELIKSDHQNLIQIILKSLHKKSKANR